MDAGRKNIAVLVQTLNNGGAERMAANMSIELSKYYNVYLFTFQSSDIDYNHGGTLIDLELPPDKNASAFTRIIKIIKRTKKLREYKKKYNIECTISHMENANFVNILSRANDKVLSIYHNMPTKNNLVNKLIHRFIAGFSDRYLMVSKLAALYMVKYFGVKEEKVGYIYNFCNVSDVKNASFGDLDTEKGKEFFKDHSKVIITMGRMTDVKAQYKLIKILAELRKEIDGLGLAILGDGPKRNELEELTKRLNVEDDVFLRGVTKAPFPYLRQSDVFVLPSINEALPMVLIEASSCGLPIVSTDMQSGAREVLAPDTDVTRAAETMEIAEYGILTPVCYKYSYDYDNLTEEEAILKDSIKKMLTDDKLREEYKLKSDDNARRYDGSEIIKEWMELIG